MTPAQLAEQRQHANLNKGRSSDNHLSRARVNHSKLPQIIRLLFEGASSKESCNETGIRGQALKRLIDSLRLPLTERFLYICAWELHGKKYCPVWKLGEGNDRPRPFPMTQAEKAKRHREKKKQLKLIQATAGSTHRLIGD